MNDKNTELLNFKLNEDSHFNIIKINENNEPNIPEKNDSSSNDFFKSDLLTLDELKSQTKDFNENNAYDLDENLNKENILKILNDNEYDDKKKIDAFDKIMYKLSYEDRKKILNDYQELFNKEKEFNNKIRHQNKLKEVFISFLQEILKCSDDSIIKQYQNKYYVPNRTSNFPYIEGNEEYIFANLIYSAYDTFIMKTNYPNSKKDGTNNESTLVSNILDKDITFPKITPINIISNPNEIKENNVKKIKIFKKFKENKFNLNKFSEKKELLKPVLEKYCSKEFQKKYTEFLENYPELIADKRIKYIYEIIIESLFYYCVCFNENRKNKLLQEYAKIFYESKKIKKRLLKDNQHLIKIKKRKGNKYIDFSLKKKIKNKDYIVSISNIEFNINFYDYIVQDLIFELYRVNNVPENDRKKFINNALNNPKFWTIQKHIKENSLYNDHHLNEIFMSQVDTMIKHKVSEKVFNEIKMFNEYNFPLLKDKFIEQVHKNVVFMKLPTRLILGLTIKKMGIVLINKGRYDYKINDQIDKNSKFILKLAECAFYKVIILHEINFHYLLVILFSNKKIESLTTPEKVFKNENDVNYELDFGDKGEAVLFGSRISVLYIKAIMDIISLNLWNNNKNKKLLEIKDIFLQLNKPGNADDIKMKDLINLNNFTKDLYQLIDKEEDIEDFKSEIGVGHIFSSGKILDLVPEKINFDGDFGKILPRGICLNSCRCDD